jgi:hypothetical protein
MEINHQVIIDYLLKRLDATAEEHFEKQFFLSDELFEQVLVIEDELIESYLSGNLSSEEQMLFEKNYLSSPYRRRRVEFYNTLPFAVEQDEAKVSFLGSLITDMVNIGRWIVEKSRLPSVPRLALASALTLVVALIVGRSLLVPPTVEPPVSTQSQPTLSVPNERPLLADLRFVYHRMEMKTRSSEGAPLVLRGGESSEIVLKTLPVVPNRKPSTREDSSIALTKDDQYAVQIQPNSRMYLYVFQWDSSGNIAVLFPNSAFNDFLNPLDSGAIYRIPSKGKWCTLDETPGLETIAIGASVNPWIELQRNIEVFRRGSAGVRESTGQVIRSLMMEVEKNPSAERYGRQFSFVHE